MAGRCLNMVPTQLQSKTVIGLAVLLAVVIGLDLAHLLTAEAVDAIKWIGGAYMGVRAVANLPGNNKPNV